jgi:hypothetical protein
MRVRLPWIRGELGDRQQGLVLDVELHHPCLALLVAADEVSVGDQKADGVGVVQAHDWALEVRPREALVARKGPELLACDLAVFHPRRRLVHGEVRRPGPDGEGVAGVRAGALLPGPPQHQWGSTLTNRAALAPAAPMLLECLDAVVDRPCRRRSSWGPRSRRPAEVCSGPWGAHRPPCRTGGSRSRT